MITKSKELLQALMSSPLKTVRLYTVGAKMVLRKLCVWTVG